MEGKCVLGIDPGLATVGYAVVEPTGARMFNMLEGGVITTPPEMEMRARLHHIYEETCGLIEEYKPDTLAIEKLFFKKNVTTGINVAQARGVVMLAAHDMEMYEYTPLEIKRRVAGSGKAQKMQVQLMIQRLLGLTQPPRPDDAADAVAAALCCLLDQHSPLAQLRK
jgi:crossover junction endodeoxyribonuclease RuvC